MNPVQQHILKTIAEYHRFMQLPKPEHPLLSVIRFEDIQRKHDNCPSSIIHHFYSIALKKNFNARMKYGQQKFDFEEGIMHFMAPKQVLTIDPGIEEEFKHTGWLLLIHPDFFWNTPLAAKIKKYEYFNYQINEALHLSEKEEALITEIFIKIADEYKQRVDQYSQDVILAQIELLLTYCERFYQRQFITRKINNHEILNQLEILLSGYFNSEKLQHNGIPTVTYIADKLNISPNYLSRLLQQLTGQSTKDFIQDKLMEVAKEKLSTTQLSINEISDLLGFEYSQSFSKLFKLKNGMTPVEFRQSFN